MAYILLIVVTLIIGFGASGYAKHQINKYSKVPCSKGMTGYQVATGMLAFYGITNVPVKMGSQGQNFFNPADNSITLDPNAFQSTSIDALATACHEVGHACQFATGYAPMKLRTTIAPVVSLASNAWIFILMIGIALNIAGLVSLAIIFYFLAVIFQLITLPVEFDASGRALTYMKTIGLPSGEIAGSSNVLRACAMTYVAAALTSILQLLYLLGQVRD